MTPVIAPFILGSAVAAPVEVKAPLVLVQGAGYTGAIFPEARGPEAFVLLDSSEKVNGYWTPTPEAVAELERQLKPAMTAAAADARVVLGPRPTTPEFRTYAQREIGEIVQHYTEYRRQYVGIVVNGSRRIFVNCFAIHQTPRGESHPYWRDRFVDVDDGGFWYWRVQYDVETKNFLGFSSNGYA